VAVAGATLFKPTQRPKACSSRTYFDKIFF
jgi:hypothetical protein